MNNEPSAGVRGNLERRRLVIFKLDVACSMAEDDRKRYLATVDVLAAYDAQSARIRQLEIFEKRYMFLRHCDARTMHILAEVDGFGRFDMHVDNAIAALSGKSEEDKHG